MSHLADIPVFHEIAGRDAYFVDPEKPTEISKTIVALSKKSASYKSMREKVFAHSKKFSPEIFTKKILKALS